MQCINKDKWPKHFAWLCLVQKIKCTVYSFISSSIRFMCKHWLWMVSCPWVSSSLTYYVQIDHTHDDVTQNPWPCWKSLWNGKNNHTEKTLTEGFRRERYYNTVNNVSNIAISYIIHSHFCHLKHTWYRFVVSEISSWETR